MTAGIFFRTASLKRYLHQIQRSLKILLLFLCISRKKWTCKRFCFVLTTFMILLWFLRILNRSKEKNKTGGVMFYNEDDEALLQFRRESEYKKLLEEKACTMSTCFDFSKCQGEFKVYVYPTKRLSSLSYEKILTSIKQSPYFTQDPKQACAFVPNVDPLDRDRLSNDFQKNLEKDLKGLPYWKNGQNHLIFNLYSGTYPDYKDTMDIDIGKAILVKASLSSTSFRYNFDISLPLFPKTHPVKGAGYLPSTASIFPFRRKYWASFKGKRYLKGIGSETRDKLYKLNNKKDIIFLTTCKHGKRWRERQDVQCPIDNALYERYDFQELLQNSTFCLTPRGRRLGSFRFLESLSVSCTPVVLANGYELPFSEVIDWFQAVVNVDERRLFDLPLILQDNTDEQIVSFRQQNQFLWEAYFSSVEKVTLTVLENLQYSLKARVNVLIIGIVFESRYSFQIMRQRVQRQEMRSHAIWNNFPGALVALKSKNYDYSLPRARHVSDDTFTAVLWVKGQKTRNVVELARNISEASFVQKVLVLLPKKVDFSEKTLWPVKTELLRMSFEKLTATSLVKTNSVFIIDNFATVEPSEIDFAFSIWKMFPNRLIGMFACSHFWNTKTLRWCFTTKLGSDNNNGYSMVLPSIAFYHRYYGRLFSEYFSPEKQSKIQRLPGCFDIALNFLIAHVTRQPPIKIQKHNPLRYRRQTAPIKYSLRDTCFKLMNETFGYVPLLYSRIVFDRDES